jgi:hypothetical protein
LHEADRRGIALDSYRGCLPDLDGYTTDDAGQGFVALYARQGRSWITGATIVAPQAGLMIGQISLMMSRRLPISALNMLSNCQSPGSDALSQVAEQFRRRHESSHWQRLLEPWFRWKRSTPTTPGHQEAPSKRT